jgi:transcriptional regulator with XRE-family HTH domain
MAVAKKKEEKKISIKDKISANASGEASNWLQTAEERLAKRGALRHARRVSLLVLRELEKQNLTQVALAEKMGVARQQVTKIVKGQENFTFETIAKLEEALGIPIITIDLKEMPAHLRVPAADTASMHTTGEDPELNMMGIRKRLEDLNQLREKLMGLRSSDTSKFESWYKKAYGQVVPSKLPALNEMEMETLRHLQSAQEFSAFEGPSRVFRMNNLKRGDWQSRLMEVFNKLQQEPLGQFVIIGSADPSAPMPSGPHVAHPAHHRSQ